MSIGNGPPQETRLSFYCLLSILPAARVHQQLMAEMTAYQPVAGGFIRLAGMWYDDALGFMVNWNFFFFEALMIAFEITAINLVLTYWRTDIPVVAFCAACIVLFALVYSSS